MISITCIINIFLFLLYPLTTFFILIYRRQDSQKRKPTVNFNKNDFHDIISANNVTIVPGINIIDLTLNVSIHILCSYINSS